MSCIAIALFTGCASNSKSSYRFQEQTTVTPLTERSKSSIVLKDPSVAMHSFGIAELATTVISYAYDAAVAAVKREAQKYTAESEAYYSGSDFYVAKNTISGIELAPIRGFHVQRSASQSPQGDVTECYSFDLLVELSPTKDSIRFVPANLKFARSKAKVASAGALDRTFRSVAGLGRYTSQVDIQIRAILTDTFANESGVLSTETIADVVIPINDFDINQERERSLDGIASQWFAYPRVTFAKAKATVEANDSNPTALGSYSLTVNVKESNEMGPLLTKSSERLQAKKADIVDSIASRLEKYLAPTPTQQPPQSPEAANKSNSGGSTPVVASPPEGAGGTPDGASPNRP